MVRRFLGIGIALFLPAFVFGLLPHVNFKNYANNCYMHAALQALFHTRPLTEAIVHLTDEEIKSFSTMVAAGQLPSDTKSRVMFKPKDAQAIFENFVRLIKDLHSGVEIERGDADYFWKTFVDSYQSYNDEAKAQGSALGEFNPGEMCESVNFIDVMLKYFLPEGLVKESFGKQYKTHVTFLGCEHSHASPLVEEKMNTSAFTINLFLRSLAQIYNNPEDAEGCPEDFDHFINDFVFQKKILKLEKSIRCCVCQKEKTLKTRNIVWVKAPRIIYIPLNRGQTGDAICADSFPFPLRIEINEENLEKSPENLFYDLYAIIIHTGGHYYTYAKDYTAGSWWLYDDLHASTEGKDLKFVTTLSTSGHDGSNLPVGLFYELSDESRAALEKAKQEEVLTALKTKITALKDLVSKLSASLTNVKIKLEAVREKLGELVTKGS